MGRTRRMSKKSSSVKPEGYIRPTDTLCDDTLTGIEYAIKHFENVNNVKVTSDGYDELTTDNFIGGDFEDVSLEIAEDEKLAMFCTIIKIGKDKAEKFLIESDWNVGEAVHFYYKFGGDVDKLKMYNDESESESESLLEGGQTTAGRVIGKFDNLAEEMGLAIMKNDALCVAYDEK